MKKKYEKILACKRRTQYEKIIEMLAHLEIRDQAQMFEVLLFVLTSAKIYSII